MKISRLLCRALIAVALMSLPLGITACGDDEPETPTTEQEVEKPEKPDTPEEPEEPEEPDVPEIPDEPEVPEVPVPTECTNIVVAHRGGSKEGGVPDNSIASLEYAMGLGCYASECDIYITADNRVVVAHADGEGKVNGLYPFRATLAELRAAGRLENGEELPSLEDYLDHCIKDGSCTRLWLDIKNITHPEALPGYSIEACRIACRIIAGRSAEAWVEFICTGNESVMRECFPLAQKAGIPIGWMANRSAAEYVSNGYGWANMSVSNMSDATHSGPHTIDEFTGAGVKLSVYTVDKAKNMKYYLARKSEIKGITTNYPKMLLDLEK